MLGAVGRQSLLRTAFRPSRVAWEVLLWAASWQSLLLAWLRGMRPEVLFSCWPERRAALRALRPPRTWLSSRRHTGSRPRTWAHRGPPGLLPLSTRWAQRVLSRQGCCAVLNHNLLSGHAGPRLHEAWPGGAGLGRRGCKRRRRRGRVRGRLLLLGTHSEAPRPAAGHSAQAPRRGVAATGTGRARQCCQRVGMLAGAFAAPPKQSRHTATQPVHAFLCT